jgi:hypothetical protein
MLWIKITEANLPEDRLASKFQSIDFFRGKSNNPIGLRLFLNRLFRQRDKLRQRLGLQVLA